MSWRTITTDDVQNYLSAAEYDAITSAAIGTGQDATDIVEQVIAGVVALVRGYVAGCKSNTLGAGETVPDELRSAAMAHIRNAIFTRLPGMGALNDETRRDELRDATARLRDASRCQIVIEQPENASEQVLASPKIDVITTPTRTATRRTLGGLL